MKVGETEALVGNPNASDLTVARPLCRTERHLCRPMGPELQVSIAMF